VNTHDTNLSSRFVSTMDRWAATRSIVGAGVAILAIAKGGMEALAATSNQAVTTANLNMRTGPGTSYPIIRVVPKGATVTVNPKGQADYISVTYAGSTGYVLGAYLSTGASNPPPDHVDTGVAKTLAAVNLRSGPGTGYQVLRVVPSGGRVSTTGTLQNGYRYVTFEGLAGWVANQYLSWDLGGTPTGETFTTTARLNLRALPSTTANVLLVIPAAATVSALSGKADGYRQVSYKGTVGWAATSYLN
jgi:D-alanyl-D-alanine carboxypeptidase